MIFSLEEIVIIGYNKSGVAQEACNVLCAKCTNKDDRFSWR